MDAATSIILVIVLAAILIFFVYGLPKISSNHTSTTFNTTTTSIPTTIVPYNTTVYIYEGDSNITPSVVRENEHNNITFIIKNVGPDLQQSLNISGNGFNVSILPKVLSPGQSTTLRFRAPAGGNYTIYSPIPGHRDLGTVATLVIYNTS